MLCQNKTSHDYQQQNKARYGCQHERMARFLCDYRLTNPKSGYFIMETKVCCRCKAILPRTSEYYHRHTDCNDGFRGNCKRCSGVPYGEHKNSVRLLAVQEGHKICPNCKRELPLDTVHFYKQKDNPNGFASHCKECNGASFKERRRVVIQPTDGSFICIRCLVHYPTINGFFPICSRNKSGYLTICRVCHREERNRYIKYNAEYVKRRREEDVSYDIMLRARQRVYGVLEGSQSKSARELIGCGTETLRKHIERQFKDGMSWRNRSEWNLDHIKPCAMFDMKDKKQQQECFNYKNIQPLWVGENNSKNATYEGVDYRRKPKRQKS